MYIKIIYSFISFPSHQCRIFTKKRGKGGLFARRFDRRDKYFEKYNIYILHINLYSFVYN